MNKDKLSVLLDSVYELEGLLHLAMAREDCPGSLPSLIRIKTQSLECLVSQLIDAEPCEDEKESVEINEAQYEDNAEVKGHEENTDALHTDIVSSWKENEADSCRSEGCVEDETLSSDVVEADQEDTVADAAEDAFESYSLPPDSDTDVCANPDNEKSPETVQPDLETPPVARSVPADDIDKMENVRTQVRTVEPRGRLVFTINDRYRFKRDLFCNSDVDFNTTLALVASMESYDEAEDYFLGELQWNAQREEVTDFLEILKNYFK